MIEKEKGHMRNSEITLRDYFAAHAPAEPGPWFTVTFDEPRPAVRAGAKWCDGCKAGTGCDGTADCDEITHVREEQEAWEKRRIKAIQTQWPWAWADAMLEARNAYENGALQWDDI